MSALAPEDIRALCEDDSPGGRAVLADLLRDRGWPIPQGVNATDPYAFSGVLGSKAVMPCERQYDRASAARWEVPIASYRAGWWRLHTDRLVSTVRLMLREGPRDA